MSVRPVVVSDDIAYEYLDDGGLLACTLDDGQYWQLGPPAGRLWQLLVESETIEAVVLGGIDVLEVSELDALDGLAAFVDALSALGLVTSWTLHTESDGAEEVASSQSPPRPHRD